jgi:hypothetical protein
VTGINNLGFTGIFAWKKNYLAFLFKENTIYFTIITEKNKANFPSLLDKYYLKKDLLERLKN